MKSENKILLGIYLVLFGIALGLTAGVDLVKVPLLRIFFLASLIGGGMFIGSGAGEIHSTNKSK